MKYKTGWIRSSFYYHNSKKRACFFSQFVRRLSVGFKTGRFTFCNEIETTDHRSRGPIKATKQAGRLFLFDLIVSSLLTCFCHTFYCFCVSTGTSSLAVWPHFVLPPESKFYCFCSFLWVCVQNLFVFPGSLCLYC